MSTACERTGSQPLHRVWQGFISVWPGFLLILAGALMQDWSKLLERHNEHGRAVWVDLLICLTFVFAGRSIAKREAAAAARRRWIREVAWLQQVRTELEQLRREMQRSGRKLPEVEP